MEDINKIAKEARIVSFNALIMAARAGDAGREFAVVAGALTTITEEIDRLVLATFNNTESWKVFYIIANTKLMCITTSPIKGITYRDFRIAIYFIKITLSRLIDFLN